MEDPKMRMELVKKPTSYKIVIPREVEAKIRFICNKVWNVEWSGTLFYSYEGSFEDNNLVIIAKDIYVMDIGSQAYTEFDMSPDVVSYMTEHPELLDYQMGLIHSHNNMATFFSGTDLNTLKDEGADRIHFVSLIVNNAGVYTAAITRKINTVRTITSEFNYESFDSIVKKGNETYTEECSYLEYYNLIIEKEDIGFKELEDKLNAIKKFKEESKAKTFNPSMQHKNIDFESLGCKSPNLKYGQLELDFKENTPNKTVSKPVEEEEEEEIFPEITDEDIEYIAKQIITGSIAIPRNSTLDIEKWIKAMPDIYSKRFGEKPLESFREWISMFIEFILENYDSNPALDEITYSEIAQGVVDYLSAFDKNDYTSAIIAELSLYAI